MLAAANFFSVVPLFLFLCCPVPGVIVFFMSLPFVALVSSGLWKSLISSSHLFGSLPTALHVFAFNTEVGVPFCCLPCPLRSRSRCCYHRSSPFHPCFLRASFCVFDPLFFFNFCCVDFFVGVIHEGNVAVLIAICVRTVTFFRLTLGILVTIFVSRVVFIVRCLLITLRLFFFVAFLLPFLVFSFLSVL